MNFVVTKRENILRETHDRAFFVIAALLFAGSAAVTAVWCNSMSAMHGMPMSGGWTMSMTWMRMPEQSWIDVAVTFIGMWMVMMVAMMLPSLLPMLWRYRRALVKTDATAIEQLTAVAGAGYLCAWILVGIAIFPLGILFAAMAMQWPLVASLVPAMTGMLVAIAGVFQFSKRKNHYLTCCREMPRRDDIVRANLSAAWRHGLHLGVRCLGCCANLMSVLLVVGVMDLRAMIVVTLAITAERLAPDQRKTSRGVGVAVLVAGLWMTAAATIASV